MSTCIFVISAYSLTSDLQTTSCSKNIKYSKKVVLYLLNCALFNAFFVYRKWNTNKKVKYKNVLHEVFLPHAESSCTLLFCLYFVSCTQKMHWREHSLADTVPLFSTILQFSSEMSNNWGIGLPCLCPSWIYCTGQQQKASLLPCLFSCLSTPCLQFLPHGSYLSFAQVFYPSTLAPLRHLFSGVPTALCSSVAFPFQVTLALIVPQTLTFLHSNVSANFTLL